MIQLILSILALLIGVGIYPVARKRPSLLSFLDAFALLSIFGLTFLHLIPHSVEYAGIIGIISVLAGFGLPALLHLSGHHHDDSHKHNHTTLLLAVVGIGVIIHTILDGIGLAMSDHSTQLMQSSGTMIGLGVLFHRLPVGIFLSMVLVPRIGLKKTWAIAITFAVTTLIGFILGHLTLSHLSITIMYAVQGLIAGALLHIVFHNVSPDGQHQKSWSKGLGALAGITALFIIEWIAPTEHHHHESVLDIWISRVMDSAPIWCIFASILAILYLISKHNPKSSVIKSIINYLDPQPLPAINNGKIHIFSATGIILLFSLFNTLLAGLWWLTAIIVSIAGAIALKNLTLCSDCQRESLCDREKSINTWLMESFTIITIIQLFAAILPVFLQPLSSWIVSLSTIIDYTILLLMIAGLLFFVARKRGFTLPGTLLCLYILLTLFHTFNLSYFANYLILILGIVLIWLYDFHPKDIEIASESSSGWLKKYSTTAAIILFVLFSISAGCISKEPLEITEHPLITATNDIDYDVLHEFEHDHNSEHHLNFDGYNEHEHHHDMDAHHDHEHIAILHHLTIFKNNPIRTICLLFFMMIGLFWLIKLGPRDLFMQTYRGHHHHDHEDENHED